MPIHDTRFFQVTDGPLAAKIDDYARRAGLTPDRYVEITLQQCEALGILATAAGHAGNPEEWGAGKR